MGDQGQLLPVEGCAPTQEDQRRGERGGQEKDISELFCICYIIVQAGLAIFLFETFFSSEKDEQVPRWS